MGRSATAVAAEQYALMGASGSGLERRDMVARRSRDHVAAWLEVHPAEIGKLPREGALALQGLIDAAQVATFNQPPERPRLEDLTVLATSLIAIGAGPAPARTADETACGTSGSGSVTSGTSAAARSPTSPPGRGSTAPTSAGSSPVAASPTCATS